MNLTKLNDKLSAHFGKKAEILETGSRNFPRLLDQAIGKTEQALDALKELRAAVENGEISAISDKLEELLIGEYQIDTRLKNIVGEVKVDGENECCDLFEVLIDIEERQAA